MGLMEWFRAGGDGKGGGALSSALGEIDGVFRPARKEQLALIEEQKRRRIDVQTGDDVDVDLERGVAVVRLTGGSPVPDERAGD
jgi:hypothetical protein